MVLSRPRRPSRTNTKKKKKKKCPFHYRGLECKSRKSRDNWNKGKFGHGIQNEAGQRLTEYFKENTMA